MVLESWKEFNPDSNNHILSAKSDSDGNCPVALSELYAEGLNKGDNCVQLIIDDGGVNDQDRKLNGSISVLGKISVEVKNQLPVIILENNHQVLEGAEIILDASTTKDADNDKLTFYWQQIGGIQVNLNEVASAKLSLSAPQVSKDESIFLKLTVFDGKDSIDFEVEIIIVNVEEDAKNQLPVVLLQHSYDVLEGTGIVLDAATTQDADNDNLTFHWQQVSGIEVILGEVESAELSFLTPEVSKDESILLKLTVDDGRDTIEFDIEITIVNAASDVDVDVDAAVNVVENDVKKSGGSLSWLLLLTSLLLVRYRFLV